MVVVLVLRLAVGERWSIIRFYNSFLHLLLLPAVILLPIMLLRRRWRLSLLFAPAVFVLATTYGPFLMPRTRALPPNALALSVLSYNLHVEREYLEPIIRVIHEAAADVVALQELSIEAARYFETELAEHYPYQALHPRENTSGQGVLSRYPLLADQYWRSEVNVIRLGHQRVELDFHGESIALFNVHLIPPRPARNGRVFDDRLRRNEISEILEKAEQEAGAVLIVGDLNLSDQADDYRRITARYADAHREAGRGPGFTYPDYSEPHARPALLPFALPVPPLLRLDYVFHGEHLLALDSTVWPDAGGSDHRPLYVELALVEGETPLTTAA